MYFDAMLQNLADMAGNTEEVDYKKRLKSKSDCVRLIEKRGDQWELHSRIHLSIGALSVERVRLLHPLRFSLVRKRFVTGLDLSLIHI